MQAIMETLFDICYLGGVLFLGVRILQRASLPQQRLFGWMAIVLGCGDAFHLVPRSWGLLHGGLEAYAAPLGFGKAVTSVTMTIFYLMLFYVWKKRYRSDSRSLTLAAWALAVVRIALCLFPQNQWLSPVQPLSWGIIRNVPFSLLGLLIIVLFWQKARRPGDPFRLLWLAVTLSFGFYLPVVLFSDTYPLVGTLMIPKTLAYVWIVWMGYQDACRSKSPSLS